MTPNYLSSNESLYQQDPRAAALQWFRSAKYGLFLHYGLYSLLGDHEWIQLRQKIPVVEYEKLASRFYADKFDADAIVEFAVDCGMKYINLTTRHHDGFCLFKTNATTFNSTTAPSKRDLVGELAQACDKRGLGFCLYYSHGRDWKHPHAARNEEWGGHARPPYDTPEPSYAYGAEYDFQKYLDFMSEQITELLTQYGPIAAIWLDGISVPLSGETSRFKCQELYDLIHGLQPQVLVSYKQGVTGTEDFFAPEHKIPKAQDGAKIVGKIAEDQEKLVEICTTMAPQSWGYRKGTEGQHKNQQDVWEELTQAGRNDYNLLLNTGPLPDGSLDPEDEPVLRAIGKRLREEAFPK